MKAAVLHAPNTPLEIEDVSLVKPGPREVLIKTSVAGLCHSDLHFLDGKYPYLFPVVMGHESSGVVEAVGDQVTYVQPGDHVVTCLSVFCGECAYCTSGRPQLCQAHAGLRAQDATPRLTRDGAPVFQFANLGSFAEQMLIHEHGLVKIDPEFPLDRAALLGCGVMTGVGAAMRTARVEPGSTVAVIGCGGVGLSAIQGAAIAGALRVIAVDMIPAKLELAKKVGATDTVDASKGDPVAAVKELGDGLGVDYSFEAIGLKVTAEQAFAMLRPGGTATIIGMIPFGTTIELNGFEFLSEKKIQGSTMGSNQFRTDVPRYIEMYKQGRLKLDELMSNRITLDDVNEGFEALARGEVTRNVIMFN